MRTFCPGLGCSGSKGWMFFGSQSGQSSFLGRARVCPCICRWLCFKGCNAFYCPVRAEETARGQRSWSGVTDWDQPGLGFRPGLALLRETRRPCYYLPSHGVWGKWCGQDQAGLGIKGHRISCSPALHPPKALQSALAGQHVSQGKGWGATSANSSST